MNRSSLVIAVAVTLSAVAAPVFAGPPLLCHPFDIGSARSLPWGAGAGWSETSPGYDVSHLAADTIALLAPATPVVVRMETLRRATIYASRDQAVAAQLLSRLTERTHSPDAYAWLDAAYLGEALRQMSLMGRLAEFHDTAPQLAEIVRDVDGVAMIEKALLLRPGDPGLEFAAAMINADKNRAVSVAHAKRARAGAATDDLVARNIAMVLN
ncbi:MAG TPA: hypothetical protein VGI12_10435 [Vicinamibacterales bacterium]|jgi:hypothetical protein